MKGERMSGGERRPPLCGRGWVDRATTELSAAADGSSKPFEQVLLSEIISFLVKIATTFD